jgi:hypothetical protein
MSGVMFIKTFTLYSLTYIVGIASTIAAHQVAPSPASLAGFQSDRTETATTPGQVSNRSAKGDRLPIRELRFPTNDKAPQAPPKQSEQSAPNPNLKRDCKPPIDVIGRCFADAGVYHHVT